MENSKHSQVTPGQCKHFVLRKKRFCRMTVKEGNDYCGEHQPKCNNKIVADTQQRIVCPLDNKHTCYASKLEKHLKVCNAREGTPSDYIIKGVNIGDAYEDAPDFQLNDVPVSKILQLVNIVNELYESVLTDRITESILFSDCNELSALIKRDDYGELKRKHLLQCSSLLGHLKKAALLESDTCFVEFGAGKGQLSFWVSKEINTIPSTSVLLVERASHRHKLDNKLDKKEGRVHRVRADIADLVLCNIDIIKQTQKVVGLAKHLCGEATDLALRCLVNSSNKIDIAGLIVAFCCHHRCRWGSYTGKAFLEARGLSQADFNIFCRMVGWAVCGTGHSRSKTRGTASKEAADNKNERDAEMGMSHEQKEEVGRRCKRILDYGRLAYLEANGYKCSLYYYVKSNISLENVCIVAVR